MENKYYTPTIEEFHVGFEYERCDNGYNWIKDVYPRAAECIRLENFILYTRVKYLDREDIESLGWKILFEDDLVFEKKVNNVLYTLIMHYSNRLEIRCSHPSISYGGFYGVAKNKSELKRIMQQIGI